MALVCRQAGRLWQGEGVQLCVLAKPAGADWISVIHRKTTQCDTAAVQAQRRRHLQRACCLAAACMPPQLASALPGLTPNGKQATTIAGRWRSHNNNSAAAQPTLDMTVGTWRAVASRTLH